VRPPTEDELQQPTQARTELDPGDLAHRIVEVASDKKASDVVLLRTGWAARWPDAKRYFGDDTPGAIDKLHFPSYGEDAARLLVEQRNVAALGVDTASIDYGQSTLYESHRTLFERDIPAFENLTALERLPARGAVVVALPMKIKGGSGGPLRAIAIAP